MACFSQDQERVLAVRELKHVSDVTSVTRNMFPAHRENGLTKSLFLTSLFMVSRPPWLPVEERRFGQFYTIRKPKLGGFFSTNSPWHSNHCCPLVSTNLLFASFLVTKERRLLNLCSPFRHLETKRTELSSRFNFGWTNDVISVQPKRQNGPEPETCLRSQRENALLVSRRSCTTNDARSIQPL